MLDVFALIVLLVLALTVIAVLGVLGALPGRIARDRKHPQADAIAVGGWVGLLFGGVLWPLILIWAYTRTAHGSPQAGPALGGTDGEVP
jgi:prepilin signal peptidase PulO-like enzyme (type II secretory pathway)